MSLAEYKLLKKSFEIMKIEDLIKLRDMKISELNTAQLRLDMIEKELKIRKDLG